MKSSTKSYQIDYDVNKAYEMLLQTSERVQAEKEECVQEIEQTMIEHSLHKLLNGREIVVKSSFHG